MRYDCRRSVESSIGYFFLEEKELESDVVKSDLRTLWARVGIYISLENKAVLWNVTQPRRTKE